jgi:5'-nucleotidase
MKRFLPAVTIAALALAACSSGSSSKTSSTSVTAKPANRTLTILVSNDDGYNAPGINTVVEALRKLPDTKVTVSAPATNQSATGSKSTPGALQATQATTSSGYPATAVHGYPVDAVNYALTHLFPAAKPDLVVSGINLGQNLGPNVAISGTVGAAKAAAAHGVPAIAVSQGVGNPLDYPSGARFVIDWITAHRAALIAHKARADVVNLNVPTCQTGDVRGVKSVPLSTSGANSIKAADCTSTATSFKDDIEAFNNGFATVTELDSSGTAVTSPTTFPAAA